MSKLPRIYQNAIEKEFHNNEKVYYAKKIDSGNEVGRSVTGTLENVEQFIDEILNLPTYSFNIPLIIYTKEKTYDTSLVAKVQEEIITFDNDVIPIRDIMKIEKKP